MGPSFKPAAPTVGCGSIPETFSTCNAIGVRQHVFFRITAPLGLKQFSISLAPFLIFVWVCLEVAEAPFLPNVEMDEARRKLLMLPSWTAEQIAADVAEWNAMDRKDP